MEHNSLATLADDTVITYSDIKERLDGMEYITIYFETPDERDGFHSMDVDYPGRIPQHVKGYSKRDIDRLMFHYNRIADVLFGNAREDKKERERQEEAGRE